MILEIGMTYALRRHARARHLRITVHPGGRVVVTVPLRGVSQKMVEEFVASKREWIARSVEAMRGVDESVLRRRNLPAGRQGRAEYLRERERAREFIVARIAVLNADGKFTFGDIRIKNQKTCWGSCSVKGNLNFNYKILFLPPAVADYVIAHELCHLKQMNHSPKFWNLVSELIPNYKELKKELNLPVDR